MSFPLIDGAHGKLVMAVAEITKPGANPIPITLVSVNDTDKGQLVVFDSTKFSKDEVVKRLRLAADFLSTATPDR